MRHFPPLVSISLFERLLMSTPTDDEGNTSHRSLGLLVARGTLLVTIAPVDGSEEIANPFLEEEEEEVQLG